LTGDHEVRPALAWSIFWLPLLLISSSVVLGSGSAQLFSRLTAENGPIETATFLAWAMAAILSARVARQLGHAREARLAGLYWVFAVGLAFLAMEEISWGQSIFSWQTPSSLSQHNYQHETNVHNIRSLLKFIQLSMLLVGIYGMVAWWALPRRSDWRWELLVPPWPLMTGFLVLTVYAACTTTIVIGSDRRLLGLVLAPRVSLFALKHSEMVELIVSLTGLSFIWLGGRLTGRYLGPTSVGPTDRGGGDRR